MRSWSAILLISIFITAARGYEAIDTYPYSPPAGQADSTAVHMADASIIAWADGYTNLAFGSDVSAYMDPALALGPARGTSYDVLCLGRGGEVTLTFSAGIRDGDGFDFAVFENGFNDLFLELAHVEVSSDGIHFVRFPNYSLNTSSAALDAKKIFGLAGKFRQGYGTPFDLNELTLAYNAALVDDTDFSAAYTAQLTNGYPLLDLDGITHIRLVDVIGDGISSRDARDWQVYDPYPTQITAGFDLDAIAVLNQPAPHGVPQVVTFDPIPHQELAFGILVLAASSDSGLPVEYALTGPATLTNDVLTFSATGVVEVVASQGGDAVYAPAAPVLRSFRIAEALQHIYVEPVAHQVQGGGTVQVRAYSNSGLPVKIQVRNGPDSALINEDTHVLDLGFELGAVTLRAYQPGNAIYAPADDVLVGFEIVAVGATNAPIPLAEWLTSNAVPELGATTILDAYGRNAILLTHERDPTVAAVSRFLISTNLVTWTNAIPEIVEITESNMVTRVLMVETNAFFRLQLESQ